MRTLNILLIERADLFRAERFQTKLPKGVSLRILANNFSNDSYSADDASVKQIEAAIEQEAFDLIVIGNYQGAGLIRARGVPDSMKAKTVIVWFKIDEKERAQYAAMGFNQFTTRTKIHEFLLQLLGFTP